MKAAHPEVEWDGDRPVGDDLEVLAAVSQELIRAKVKLVAKQRGPFLEDARRRGASDVVSLDLAPMVFARVPSAQVDALAEHKSVRQVRAPAGWEPTMNTAHNAVGANWTDSKGYTGGGVVVGDRRVRTGRLLAARACRGTRLDSYRVSSTGRPASHARGTYNNAAAISHVSWAAAIAVGRGSTYKGIANAARLVDVSADFNPTSDAADPRILKAVDCAIVAGRRPPHHDVPRPERRESVLDLERLLRCGRLGPPSAHRRQRRQQLRRVELALPGHAPSGFAARGRRGTC